MSELQRNLNLISIKDGEGCYSYQRGTGSLIDDWTPDNQTIVLRDGYLRSHYYLAPWYAYHCSKSIYSSFWWLYTAHSVGSGINPSDIFYSTSLEF